MSVELGRRLLGSGAVGRAELQAVLFRHLTGGAPFLHALAEVGRLPKSDVGAELARSGLAHLETLEPSMALAQALPSGFCRALLAVPVGRDASGRVEVAVADPYDAHIASEFSHQLGCAIRLFHAPLARIEAALQRIEQRKQSAPAADPAGGEWSSFDAPFATDAPPRALPIPLVRRIVRNGPVEASGVIAMATSDESPPPSEAPITKPGPFGLPAPAPPLASIDHVIDILRSASGRDEVLVALIAGMATVAERVGVFALRKTGFRGVACNAALADIATFRALDLPAADPTVLAEAARRGSYFGPLPRNEAHETLWSLRAKPDEKQDDGGAEPGADVLAFVVPVSGRPAAVVFADGLADSFSATRRAEQLAEEAGQALARVVAEAKTSRRGPR